MKSRYYTILLWIQYTVLYSIKYIDVVFLMVYCSIGLVLTPCSEKNVIYAVYWTRKGPMLYFVIQYPDSQMTNTFLNQEDGDYLWLIRGQRKMYLWDMSFCHFPSSFSYNKHNNNFTLPNCRLIYSWNQAPWFPWHESYKIKTMVAANDQICQWLCNLIDLNCTSRWSHCIHSDITCQLGWD